MLWDLGQNGHFPFSSGLRSHVQPITHLSDLEIAWAARGPYNQQGAQISVPETLWVQLPHYSPHSGFGEASDPLALGLGLGGRWGREEQSV